METSFWVLAIVGTVVFLLKLILMFLGMDGDHGSGDAGGDAHGLLDADAGDDQSTSAFAFLSLQSLATFFMGAGWMGLVAIKTWRLDLMAASLLSIFFGAILVFLLGKLLQAAFRLESSGTLDLRQAKGKIATVYARIPDSGSGQVQVEVQGRLMTLTARSSGGPIPTGRSVQVSGVGGDGVLIVAPYAPSPSTVH
jgi:hypothetical protein